MFTSPEPATCLDTGPVTRMMSTSPDPAMETLAAPATPRKRKSPEPAMEMPTSGDWPPPSVMSPDF